MGGVVGWEGAGWGRGVGVEAGSGVFVYCRCPCHFSAAIKHHDFWEGLENQGWDLVWYDGDDSNEFYGPNPNWIPFPWWVQVLDPPDPWSIPLPWFG